MADSHPRPICAGNARQRHRRYRLLPGVLVPPARSSSRPIRADQRLVLHFGAVDHSATVWVNGTWIGTHDGGYTPFEFDVTRRSSLARTSSKSSCAPTTIPHDLAKPRGKQDWQLEPHSIWYPRTTGIWQTVWLERVPADAHSGSRVDAECRALGNRLRGVARWRAPRRSAA